MISVLIFIGGLVLFYGGAYLNYLSWKRVSGDAKTVLVGFMISSILMAIGLTMMFFIAPSFLR